MRETTNTIRAIRVAELELGRILRMQKSQDRPPQVIVDLLERDLFGMVGSLGELNPKEIEWVQKFMRAYVWLGWSEHASKLSKVTGVSVNWTDERELVERGYRTIAKGAVRVWGGYRELNQSSVTQLRRMRDLTSVGIPEDAHSYLIKSIAHSPSYKSRQLRNYLSASGTSLTQEDVDELYLSVAASAVTSADVLKRAVSLYDLAKLRPLSARAALLDKYTALQHFPTIEKFLPLFVDTTNTEEVEELVAGALPLHSAAVVKLVTGGTLSPEEVRGVYQFIFNKYTHYNLDFSYIKHHIIDNLVYLTKHGIRPPEDMVDDFYRMIDLTGLEYFTKVLPLTENAKRRLDYKKY